ncbi:MAG: hypothetical protein CM1200mP16_17250 [Nitrospina sp.]|nr:MAG: hypothetical protein CM1200mP16_17250 [Nitrospina sp.]
MRTLFYGGIHGEIAFNGLYAQDKTSQMGMVFMI